VQKQLDTGTQIFKKPSSCLKILDTRMVPLGKFHTEDPPVLLHTVHTFVSLGTWCLGFLHHWGCV